MKLTQALTHLALIGMVSANELSDLLTQGNEANLLNILELKLQDITDINHQIAELRSQFEQYGVKISDDEVNTILNTPNEPLVGIPQTTTSTAMSEDGNTKTTTTVTTDQSVKESADKKIHTSVNNTVVIKETAKAPITTTKTSMPSSSSSSGSSGSTQSSSGSSSSSSGSTSSSSGSSSSGSGSSSSSSGSSSSSSGGGSSRHQRSSSGGSTSTTIRSGGGGSTTDLTALRQRLIQLLQQRQQRFIEVKKLNEMINQMKIKISNFNNNLQSKQTEINQIITKITNENNQINQIRQNQKTTIVNQTTNADEQNRLKQEIQQEEMNLQKKIQDNQHQLNQTDIQIKQLTGGKTNEQIEQEIVNINKEMTVMQNGGNQTEINGLTKKLQETRQKTQITITQINQLITKITTINETHHKKIQQMNESKNNSQNNQLNILKEQMTKNTNQANGLRKQLESFQNQINTVNSQIEQIKNQYKTNVDNLMNDQITRINQIKAEIEGMTNAAEKKEMEAYLAKLKLDYETQRLNSILEAKNKELQTVLNEKNTLEVTIKTTTTNVTELNKQLEEYKRQLPQIKAEHEKQITIKKQEIEGVKSSMENNIQNSNQKLIEVQKQIDELEKITAQKVQEKLTFMNQIEEVKKSHQAAIEAKNKKMADLDNISKQINTQIIEKKKFITENNNKVEDLTNQMNVKKTEFQATITQKDSEIKRLNHEMTTNRANYAKQLTDLQLNFDKKMSEIKVNEGQETSLKQVLNTHSTTMIAEKNKYDNLIKESQSKLEEMINEVNKANDEVLDITNKRTVVLNEKKQIHEDIVKLQDQHRQEIEKINNEGEDDINKRTVIYRTKITQINNQVEDVHKRRDDVQRKLNEIKTQISNNSSERQEKVNKLIEEVTMRDNTLREIATKKQQMVNEFEGEKKEAEQEQQMKVEVVNQKLVTVRTELEKRLTMKKQIDTQMDSQLTSRQSKLQEIQQKIENLVHVIKSYTDKIKAVDDQIIAQKRENTGLNTQITEEIKKIEIIKQQFENDKKALTEVHNSRVEKYKFDLETTLKNKHEFEQNIEVIIRKITTEKNEFENRVTKFRNEIEDQKKANDGIKTQQTTIQYEMKDLTSRITTEKEKLQIAKTEFADAKNKHETTVNEHNDLYKKTIDEMKMELVKQSQVTRDTDAAIKKAEQTTAEEINRLNENITILNKTLIIKNESVTNMKTRFDHVSKIGDKLKIQISQEDKKLGDLRNEVTRVTEEWKIKLEQTSEAHKKEVTRRVSEIETIQTMIESETRKYIDAKEEAKKSLEEYKAFQYKAKQELDILKVKNEAHDRTIVTIETNITRLNTEITNVQEIIKQNDLEIQNKKKELYEIFESRKNELTDILYKQQEELNKSKDRYELAIKRKAELEQQKEDLINNRETIIKNLKLRKTNLTIILQKNNTRIVELRTKKNEIQTALDKTNYDLNLVTLELRKYNNEMLEQFKKQNIIYEADLKKNMFDITHMQENFTKTDNELKIVSKGNPEVIQQRKMIEDQRLIDITRLQKEISDINKKITDLNNQITEHKKNQEAIRIEREQSKKNIQTVINTMPDKTDSQSSENTEMIDGVTVVTKNTVTTVVKEEIHNTIINETNEIEIEQRFIEQSELNLKKLQEQIKIKEEELLKLQNEKKTSDNTPIKVDTEKISDLTQQKMQYKFGEIDSLNDALLTVQKLIQSHKAMKTQFDSTDEDIEKKMEPLEKKIIEIDGMIEDEKFVKEIAEEEGTPFDDSIINDLGKEVEKTKKLMEQLEDLDRENEEDSSKSSAKLEEYNKMEDDLEKKLRLSKDDLEDIVPPRPTIPVEEKCPEGQTFSLIEMACISGKDGIDLAQRSSLDRPQRSSSTPEEYGDQFRAYQDRMKSPIVTPDNYEEVPGEPFSFGVFVACLFGAMIGAGVICGAVAYCNRDDENPFEEKMNMRIYVEGEDKGNGDLEA